MKKIAVLGLFLALLFAVNAATTSDMERRVFSMVNDYWKAVDLISKNPELNLTAMDKVKAEADLIANEIITALEKDDALPYYNFVKLYNRSDIRKAPEFTAPLNLIADQVIEYKKARDLTPDSYFPGYGYADPNFVYRRGEEASTEVLSVYWKRIERTLEAGKKFSMQIEVGASAQFGGSADVKEIGPRETVNIGGSIKEVVMCEITVKDTIKTLCTIKYQNVKTFFKLYKAEKTWWGMSHGDWIECGKTYQIFDEESGLPVVEVPGSNTPLNTEIPVAPNPTPNPPTQH
ncbi:MAG: hypothetical protein PHW04_05165 [Candidatus Wallbacteria bacterium]|nr:hypothetical protein [Candidatus Wallbacteria bacterium]